MKTQNYPKTGLWRVSPWVLILLLLASAALSCASYAPGFSESVPYDEYFDDYGESSRYAEPSSQSSSSRDGLFDDDSVHNSPQEIGENTNAQAQERKRIYSGYASLEVRDSQETSDQIRERVLELGGYVELSRNSWLTVRVPAQSFQSFFDWTLEQGRVLREEIQSYDVTDYFRDINTRLEIATQSRDRLYQLLENSTDVDERVAILREIGRLSELIESYQATLGSLENSIQYSRIDIELTSALDEPVSQARIPFPWIRDLAPGQFNIRGTLPELGIDFGSSFAVLEDDGTYYAESAKGVRIRIGMVKNDPLGDLEFWKKALVYHYGPLFQNFSPVEINDAIQGIQVESFDFEPYLYEVLVSVQEDQLIVFEIFYPSKELHQEISSQAHAILQEAQL